MFHRVFPFVLVMLGSTLALPAEATPAPRIAVRLDYQSVDPSHGCPTSDELGFMLAAEFGYPIVREDARGALTVAVRVVDDKYEAELSAPNPLGGDEAWRWTTDKQMTCRELGYDVATVVGIALGPRAWTNGEPPETLVAPLPKVDVGTSMIFREPPRLLAKYLSTAPRTNVETTPPTNTETPVQVEAALGASVMVYGMPNVAIGGNGTLGIRWKRFAVAMDLRGAITPQSGFGTPQLDARASLFTASFLPCATMRFVDICGSVNASIIGLDAPPPIVVSASDGFSMGFGARLVGRYPLSSRFTFLGFADINGQLRSITVAGPTAGDPAQLTTYWRSPYLRIAGGIGIAANVFE